MIFLAMTGAFCILGGKGMIALIMPLLAVLR